MNALMNQVSCKMHFKKAVRLLSTLPNLEFVKLDNCGTNGRVGLMALNRPKALNALSPQLMNDIIAARSHFENDASIGCVVITGKRSQKAFVAGGDIKEMKNWNFASTMKSQNAMTFWSDFVTFSKPIIAAVNGFALGGGCELAMTCDIVYAGEKAKFGQPEITIGTIPGAGGTQRLPKAVSKSMAMEINLTGIPIDAQTALQHGLVSKVFPVETVVNEAVKTADVISGHAKLIVQMAKEATNASFESSLAEGLRTERRLFHATFSTHDRKEGMTAFVEKRKPQWKDK